MAPPVTISGVFNPVYVPYISDRPTFWSRLLAILALATCVFVGVNMYLLSGIQRLQRDLATRQELMTQSTQAQGLAREVVSVLATVARRNNDEQIKQMLAIHGITLAPGTPMPADPGGK